MWSVLYTKHKTQKRKTWSDGLLKEDAARGAANLYALLDDGCAGSLLETLRIPLSIADGVEFEAERYLVQIEGRWTGSPATSAAPASSLAPATIQLAPVQLAASEVATAQPHTAVVGAMPSFSRQRRPGLLGSSRTGFRAPSVISQPHPPPPLLLGASEPPRSMRMRASLFDESSPQRATVVGTSAGNADYAAEAESVLGLWGRSESAPLEPARSRVHALPPVQVQPQVQKRGQLQLPMPALLEPARTSKAPGSAVPGGWMFSLLLGEEEDVDTGSAAALPSSTPHVPATRPMVLVAPNESATAPAQAPRSAPPDLLLSTVPAQTSRVATAPEVDPVPLPLPAPPIDARRPTISATLSSSSASLGSSKLLPPPAAFSRKVSSESTPLSACYLLLPPPSLLVPPAAGATEGSEQCFACGWGRETSSAGARSSTNSTDGGFMRVMRPSMAAPLSVRNGVNGDGALGFGGPVRTLCVCCVWRRRPLQTTFASPREYCEAMISALTQEVNFAVAEVLTKYWREYAMRALACASQPRNVGSGGGGSGTFVAPAVASVQPAACQAAFRAAAVPFYGAVDLIRMAGASEAAASAAKRAHADEVKAAAAASRKATARKLRAGRKRQRNGDGGGIDDDAEGQSSESDVMDLVAAEAANGVGGGIVVATDIARDTGSTLHAPMAAPVAAALLRLGAKSRSVGSSKGDGRSHSSVAGAPAKAATLGALLLETGGGDVPALASPDAELAPWLPAGVAPSAAAASALAAGLTLGCQLPRLFLKIDNADKEASTVYARDDLWLVASDGAFGVSTTHGRSRSSLPPHDAVAGCCDAPIAPNCCTLWPTATGLASATAQLPASLPPPLPPAGSGGVQWRGSGDKSGRGGGGTTSSFWAPQAATSPILFFARALFHGPSANNMVELVPVVPLANTVLAALVVGAAAAGAAPPPPSPLLRTLLTSLGRWPSAQQPRCTRVVAIRGPNVQAEAQALTLLVAALCRPERAPLLPTLLPLPPPAIGRGPTSLTTLTTSTGVGTGADAGPGWRLALSLARKTAIVDAHVAAGKLNDGQAALLRSCAGWLVAREESGPATASPLVLCHGAFGSGKSACLTAVVACLCELLDESEGRNNTGMPIPLPTPAPAVTSSDAAATTSLSTAPIRAASPTSPSSPARAASSSLSSMSSSSGESSSSLSLAAPTESHRAARVGRFRQPGVKAGLNEYEDNDELMLPHSVAAAAAASASSLTASVRASATSPVSAANDCGRAAVASRFPSPPPSSPEEPSCTKSAPPVRPPSKQAAPQLRAAPRCRILVAAATNTAVDRVLVGLLRRGFTDFARVGSARKVDSRLLSRMLPASDRDDALRAAARELAEVAALRGGNGESSAGVREAQALLAAGGAAVRASTSSVRVVGTTCAAAAFSILQGLTFPIVVLDEASQMVEPASGLALLRFGARFAIAAGDPLQLPPVLREPPPPVAAKAAAATDGGQTLASSTLFTRLASAGAPISRLNVQYRCHPRIAALASRLFYGGNVVSGIAAWQRGPRVRLLPPVVVYDTSNMPLTAAAALAPALAPAAARAGAGELATSGPLFPPPAPARVPDAAEAANGSRSLTNAGEEAVVVRLVLALLTRKVSAADVGVICLYKGAAARIFAALSSLGVPVCASASGEGVSVATVDSFQGAEKEIVILATTRTQPACGVASVGASARQDAQNTPKSPQPPHSRPQQTQHVDNAQRLCVALTRATRHLLIVAHARALASYPVWGAIFADIFGGDSDGGSGGGEAVLGALRTSFRSAALDDYLAPITTAIGSGISRV